MKNRTKFSLEVFPAKTEAGIERLKRSLDEMAKLSPEFISVTCGAGNSKNTDNLKICSYVQNRLNIRCVAHVTCVNLTKENIDEKLRAYRNVGIENLLLLRGDLPHGQKKLNSDFRYAVDLVRHVKKEHPDFRFMLAGYPEGHLANPSGDDDFERQLAKAKEGAEALVTQLFFINKVFLNYSDRLKRKGFSGEVLPGIFAITDRKQVLKIAELCRPYFSHEILRACVDFAEDPEKMHSWGIAHAVRQIKDLQDAGVDHFHFYTMNSAELVQKVCGPFLRKEQKSQQACA